MSRLELDLNLEKEWIQLLTQLEEQSKEGHELNQALNKAQEKSNFYRLTVRSMLRLKLDLISQQLTLKERCDVMAKQLNQQELDQKDVAFWQELLRRGDAGWYRSYREDDTSRSHLDDQRKKDLLYLRMHQMDTVIPDLLFIGDDVIARDEELLKKYHIQHILQVRPDDNGPKHSFVEYKIVSIRDNDYEPIAQYLDPCVSHLHQNVLKQEATLVHCHAGCSRSATLVLAYLMAYQQCTYEAALDQLQKIRPIIRPNDGFVKALQLFEL